MILIFNFPFSASGLSLSLYENLGMNTEHTIYWSSRLEGLVACARLVLCFFYVSWRSLSSNKQKHCLALQCVHSISPNRLLHSFISLTKYEEQKASFVSWKQPGTHLQCPHLPCSQDNCHPGLVQASTGPKTC